MATIPLSALVKVNPSILSAAGSAVDLLGLVLTNSTAVPIGTVKSFSSAADVGAFFGLSSTEYTLAQKYFAGYAGCTKLPGAMLFAQYNSAAVSGYVRGGSMASVTLTELKAMSGVLTVTVDGTAKTSSSINLSAATSFSNAATIIQAGFSALGGTVAWDAQRSAFTITSSSTGTASIVSFATGTLSANLKLTSATGAVTSVGAAIATPNAFMSALVMSNQNWALFTSTFEPILADKVAFSQWAASTGMRYGYVGWDSDAAALTSGSTATWMYQVKQSKMSGTFGLYGDATHASMVLGFAASLDFDRLNGRATVALKTQDGLTPFVTNQTDSDALIANGYNFYGVYANAKRSWNIIYPGQTSARDAADNPVYLDTFLNQIWLNSNLQLAMMNLLMSAGSIPYNDSGYGQVAAACSDPINAAVNFGAIRAGIALSESQKNSIKAAIGADVSGVIEARGWYLRIAPATAAIRVQRASPSMTLYYTDGQSIQALTLASVAIM